MRRFTPRCFLACMLLVVVVLLSGVQPYASASVSKKELSSHIKSYLKNKHSPLATYSDDFVRWGVYYGVDPRFLVAISGGETSFATDPKAAPASTVGHNAWGIGPGWHYRSWPYGIRSAAKLLGTYYRDRETVANIRHKWAPSNASNDPNGLNENWIRVVSRFYQELGGNPNASVFMKPGSSNFSKEIKGKRGTARQYMADPLRIQLGHRPKPEEASEVSAPSTNYDLMKFILLGGIGVIVVAVGLKKRFDSRRRRQDKIYGFWRY